MPVWSSSDVQPRSGIAMTAPREGERFLPACRSARRSQDRPDLGWAPTMWWRCAGRAGRDERRREANAAFLLCLSLSRFPGEALMFCHQSASDGLVGTCRRRDLHASRPFFISPPTTHGILSRGQTRMARESRAIGACSSSSARGSRPAHLIGASPPPCPRWILGNGGEEGRFARAEGLERWWRLRCRVDRGQ